MFVTRHLSRVTMIYTLGHSTHPLETFIGLLKQHGIEALVDIRSVPMSRFNPQFRQKDLKAALEAVGLDYVYRGDALGGQPRAQHHNRQLRIPYAARVQMPEFKAGLAALKNLAAQKRVTIMCAEKEPLNCHRTLLVARALAEENFPVLHILGDGNLRTQEEVEEDLLNWRGLEVGGLFDDPATRLEEAYARRSGAGTYKRK